MEDKCCSLHLRKSKRISICDESATDTTIFFSYTKNTRSLTVLSPVTWENAFRVGKEHCKRTCQGWLVWTMTGTLGISPFAMALRAGKLRRANWMNLKVSSKSWNCWPGRSILMSSLTPITCYNYNTLKTITIDVSVHSITTRAFWHEHSTLLVWFHQPRTPMRSINSRHICVVQLSDLAFKGGLRWTFMPRWTCSPQPLPSKKDRTWDIIFQLLSLQSSKTHPAPSRSHGSSEDDTCRRRSFIRFLQTIKKPFSFGKVLNRLGKNCCYGWPLKKAPRFFGSDSLPKGKFPKKPEAPGRCGIYDGPAEKLFAVDLGKTLLNCNKKNMATLQHQAKSDCNWGYCENGKRRAKNKKPRSQEALDQNHSLQSVFFFSTSWHSNPTFQILPIPHHLLGVPQ